MTTTQQELDARDAELLASRVEDYDAIDGPREGDWVRFADGVERRISYIWRDEAGEAFSVQTSAGGSYYLGSGYVSMSGSLFSGVKPETLTETGDRRPGSVWFFHHNYAKAHNGVDASMLFRVFACTEAAKS